MRPQANSKRADFRSRLGAIGRVCVCVCLCVCPKNRKRDGLRRCARRLGRCRSCATTGALPAAGCERQARGAGECGVPCQAPVWGGGYR